MPKLKSRDKHSCFICHQIFAARFSLRDHLIKLSTDKKKGPRCPGLKKVIPSDVWTDDIRMFGLMRCDEVGIDFATFA